jgi:hypothetical protein
MCPVFCLQGAAFVSWLRGSISYEVDAWYVSLSIYRRLPELSRAKVLRDMQLIQKQYAAHPYHGPHHAKDVVRKCGAMLRRDRTKLRRWLRERTGCTTERQYALFELAIVLAAAFHDAGHPGECCCCFLQCSADVSTSLAVCHTSSPCSSCYRHDSWCHSRPTLSGLCSVARIADNICCLQLVPSLQRWETTI